MDRPGGQGTGGTKVEAASGKSRKHWAFLPPVRPNSPPVVHAENWVHTPIDQFILARLESRRTPSVSGKRTAKTLLTASQPRFNRALPPTAGPSSTALLDRTGHRGLRGGQVRAPGSPSPHYGRAAGAGTGSTPPAIADSKWLQTPDAPAFRSGSTRRTGSSTHLNRDMPFEPVRDRAAGRRFYCRERHLSSESPPASHAQQHVQ